MNASIMATRQAIAIQNIEEQVKRLGGEIVSPSGRGEPGVKQLLLLEAIGNALATIEIPDPQPAAKVAKAKGKGE